MALSTYPLVAVGDLWTASDNNTYNKANLNELLKYVSIGDIVYSTSATSLDVLSIGSNYNNLTFLGGVPSWQSGLTSAVSSLGDLVVGTGANALTNLPIGSEYKDLSVVTGTLSWQDGPISKVTTSQDLLVGSGANSLSRLGLGSNGYLLSVVSGALAYASFTPPDFSLCSLTLTNLDYDDSFDYPHSGICTWSREIEDPNGWHSTVTNKSRITVDATARYAVFAYLDIFAYGITDIILYINGSEIKRIVTPAIKYEDPGNPPNIFWEPFDLNAGDYVEIGFNIHDNFYPSDLSSVVRPRSFIVQKLG